MVDSVLHPPETISNIPSSSLVVTAWEMANGNLLKDNGFRALGLPVLATGREISKRAEEIRLARELEVDLPPRGFAPAAVLSAERTRAVLQSLSDPFRRLLAEIFWFWPASYPKSGGDDAIEALAENQADRAIAAWAERQVESDVIAFHNLAVYHLMLALELELSATPIDAVALNTWWEAAIRFWQLTVERDEFWGRLEERVTAIGDPQLKVESVALLRGVFADILGGINGSLALKAVEADDQRTASRHVVLLGRVYERPEQLDAALARSVRSVVARIDARVAEAYRALEANTEDAAKVALSLVEHGGQDIHCLNTLCGSDSAVATSAAAEVSKLILEATLTPSAASSQRSAALLALAYAHGLRHGSETDRRVRNFYQMALSQAMRAQDPANSEPEYAQLYAVVAEQMLTEWSNWGAQPAARRLVADEIAAQFREVARGALSERDDIAFALHAYELMLQLPCESLERDRRLEERAQIQREFSLRTSRAIVLTNGTEHFQLNHRGVQWNDRHWPIESVTAVRFGKKIITDRHQRKRIFGLRLGETEVLLDEENFLGGDAGAENYTRLVAACEHFVIPPLIKMLVTEIRKGGLLQFDELTISRDEVLVPMPGRLRAKPTAILHRDLQHHTENDAWTVSGDAAGTWKRKYLIVDTWNALIMGRVLATLAEGAAPPTPNE